ncbi:MAG: hypothetical protein R3B93_18565 [Bacteroidia bacterium]
MSEKSSLLEPQKIHLVNFKIIRGQIESPFGFDQEKIEDYSFMVDFDMAFNLEEKLVKADFSVEIKTVSAEEQDEEAFGLFSFVFIYEVENLEDLAEAKNDGIEVQGGLGNALASITYSTSRGVLMTRFQGTELESFILPVIDPNNLLK